MRKIRFLVALIVAFIQRFKFLLLGSIIFGIVLFLGFKILYPRVLPQKVEYIGISGRYHIDELPDTVLSLIGEGLTKIDASGTPQPALATRWESPDKGKTWIFTLADNRTWHDGTKLDSASVQYSFSDVTIERPNNKTIVFKLTSSYAPFPLVVSHSTFSHGLIGTGEWRVTNISIKSSFVEELQLTNREGTKRILRFYPNEDAAKTAYKLGQVDSLEDVLNPTPFDTWSGVTVSPKRDATRYVAVFFNERSEHFKDNKTLRQALSYAIDKSMWTGNERALGPIPEESWAYNPQIKPYDYDLNRAKELLKPILNNETLHIKLTTNPTLLSVAEHISKNWKQVGVNAEVQASATLPDDYDAYLTVYEVSLDPDQYLTWHSTQDVTNITHYANQRIDKLLEDGRLEMNQENRKKIYLDFQRFLLEDAPAAFLYHPTSFDIIRK